MGIKRFHVLALLLAAAVSGCGWCPPILPRGPAARPDAPIPNPLMAPVADREFLWNQVVDTVDNYFRIAQEERVKLVGGVLTEGRIDTYPTIGSTLLEPWAEDSTPGYERVQATLQTIRRRALVRVMPTQGGYLVHVAVHKEKEEVSQSEHATVVGVVGKHDGLAKQPTSDPALTGAPQMGSPKTLGWVPLGRDLSLERRILQELRARLLDSGT